jgi:hypothetical protein
MREGIAQLAFAILEVQIGNKIGEAIGGAEATESGEQSIEQGCRKCRQEYCVRQQYMSFLISVKILKYPFARILQQPPSAGN